MKRGIVYETVEGNSSAATTPFQAQRTYSAFWNLRHHALTWRERAEREAAAVGRLGEPCVGAILLGLDNHIVGFSRAHPEFIDLDGFHMLPVGLDHRHFQTRDAHIEMRHRCGVDDAQPDAFAGFENSGPRRCRWTAVEGEIKISAG